MSKNQLYQRSLHRKHYFGLGGQYATLITGLILGHLNGYIYDALMLQPGSTKNQLIGIGMWLGIIMAFNVWVFIWPSQKSSRYCRSSKNEKLAAAKKAMLFQEQIHFCLYLCFIQWLLPKI